MHSDYIIRMIQQFSEMLATIIAARKAKQNEHAMVTIIQAGKTFLDQNISELLVLEPKELLAKFMKDGHLEVEKTVMCADLIHESALVCLNKEMDVAANRFNILALYLYIKAAQAKPDNQVYRDKAMGLMDALKHIQLPPDMKMD